MPLVFTFKVLGQKYQFVRLHLLQGFSSRVLMILHTQYQHV